MDACRAQEVAEPEYEVMPGFVKIVFKRVNGDVSSLNGSLRELYLLVKNNPGIKIKQVAEARGKSASTVWKQLKTLKKMNLVEYRDSDKTGGYYAKCFE